MSLPWHFDEACHSPLLSAMACSPPPTLAPLLPWSPSYPGPPPTLAPFYPGPPPTLVPLLPRPPSYHGPPPLPPASPPHTHVTRLVLC